MADVYIAQTIPNPKCTDSISKVPKPISNVELYATLNKGGTVSNEKGAGTIYGTHGSHARHVNEPPPANPVSNHEVQFTSSHPPVQNNPNSSIAWIPGKSIVPNRHTPWMPAHYAPAPLSSQPPSPEAKAEELKTAEELKAAEPKADAKADG